jgi:hypothetical protein
MHSRAQIFIPRTDLSARVMGWPGPRVSRINEPSGHPLAASACVARGASSRERVVLGADWRFRTGDPSDAGGLNSSPLHPLLPITGGFLSPLEDDLAPVVVRGGEAERTFGSAVSWVRPEFTDTDWPVASLAKGSPTATTGSVGEEQVTWYRRRFVVPVADADRHVNLDLCGSFDQSLVWLNGQCLGRVGGGVRTFRKDVTSFILFGEENTLVLRSETSLASPALPGGMRIPRSAALVMTDSLHLGLGGSLVSGCLKGGDTAELSVRACVQNEDWNAQRGILSLTLLDPGGRARCETAAAFQIFGQDRNVLEQRLCVDDATWMLENQGEYLIRARILVGGCVRDEETTPFDIREAFLKETPDLIDLRKAAAGAFSPYLIESNHGVQAPALQR